MIVVWYCISFHRVNPRGNCPGGNYPGDNCPVPFHYSLHQTLFSIMFNDRYQEEKSRCGLQMVFLKISNGFSGVFPLKQLWESLKNNFIIGVFQKVYFFDSLLQNFYPLCSVSSHSWNLVTIESLSYHASNHIGYKIMILYVLVNPLSRLDCKLAIILC